jgi:hypothetical protein
LFNSSFVLSFIPSSFLPSFDLRSGELEIYCKLLQQISIYCKYSKTLCRAVWYVLTDFYLADNSTNLLQRPMYFY